SRRPALASITVGFPRTPGRCGLEVWESRCSSRRRSALAAALVSDRPVLLLRRRRESPRPRQVGDERTTRPPIVAFADESVRPMQRTARPTTATLVHAPMLGQARRAELHLQKACLAKRQRGL